MVNTNTTKKWYKKKRWWAGILAVLALTGGIFYMQREKVPTYEFMIVSRGELVQEVSVTGKVKPAQAVDMQFENSGRISKISYKVGDKVNAGATITTLENEDLQAAVNSAKADLEKTTRNFNSLKDPSVSSSLRVELENAKVNLDQVVKKADGDLASKYNSGLNIMREALTQVDGSSAVLEYIRKTYFETKNASDDYIKQLQAQIDDNIKLVRAEFTAVDQPGTIVDLESYGKFDSALKKLLNACQSARTAFTFLQGEMEKNSSLITSSTDRSSINSEAAAISSDLSAVSGAIQSITDQKITNDKNISDAKSKLATAEAAFPTSEDITQKEAALLSAQSQLRKSAIIAPFTGIIGKIDAERGQTVNSSTIIISLISAANYQIEANITEIDIGKVKVGDAAALTLDAYGSQTKFNARVSAIDTAATVVEGVTTYKTIFDFDGKIKENIRPNMTANVDIQTDKKENVISVPQRAVISKNGSKIVRVYRGHKLPLEERQVQTGMSGKDGMIEVVSGLLEGEQVVTFVREQ